MSERQQARACAARDGSSSTQPHARITCRAHNAHSGGVQPRVFVALALHHVVPQRDAEGGARHVAAFIVSLGSAFTAARALPWVQTLHAAHVVQRKHGKVLEARGCSITTKSE